MNEVRVLLVEDNITNQQVALRVLRKLGIRVDAVSNGAEAVEVLQSTAYHLVFMDVQMPVMDGLEATRRIRDPHSGMGNHGIPIIAMTAFEMPGDRERCLEAGMNDYVSKPIDRRALAETLGRWLGREYLGMRDEEREVEQRSEVGMVVFDREAMVERLLDDEELAKGVITGFLADMPQQIQALEELVEAEDAKGVERQAHTIKGAAASVGGEALRGVAFEIEKQGKIGDVSELEARMTELQRQFDRLRVAVEKHYPDLR